MGLIKDCLQLMHIAHNGRLRASGHPYQEHPKAVARLYHWLCPNDHLGFGVCLVHDVIEDSSITLAEIAGFWGLDLALMVDKLSKKHRSEFRSEEERLKEYYYRFFSGARKDKRIGLVKFADRWDNVRTTLR